jgi:hypothetical protein
VVGADQFDPGGLQFDPGLPPGWGQGPAGDFWKITGNFQRATQAASVSGQMVAFGFIVFGMMTIFTGNLFNGLWLVFIGWFLQNAAANSYAQANLREMLRGVTVAQVMQTEPPRAGADDVGASGGGAGSDRRAAVFLRGGKRLAERPADFEGYHGGAAQGVGQDPGARCMVPLERLVQVRPEMKVLEALQAMDDADVAQAPVMEAGRMVGC